MASQRHNSPHKPKAIRNSAGGGAFSPSVGRAAGQVTENVADDISSCTDQIATAMKRTSLVQNGCCPGGPEHWLANLVWCPAVKGPAATQTSLKSVELGCQTEDTIPRRKQPYQGRLRELSKTPTTGARLRRDNGAFNDMVLGNESSRSENASWSTAGSDSEASDQESAAAEQKATHGASKDGLLVKTSGGRFHQNELDIFASPHRAQFQKLRKKYAVRGANAGVQTDSRATTRECGTQAEFDAFANITGVSKKIQLFESARFTEDGPAVVKFFAEYKLNAKFALENTNVHSGTKTRQEFNLQELKPAEVGELKSLAALHLSRVLDQHKLTPAIHSPGSGLSSSTKLLQSVMLGGQADALTVTLRARTDFTNASHPLFGEYQQADRLIRAQLGSKVGVAAESTAVANLAHAELFVLGEFSCATSEVKTSNLSLDGVMHACTNLKIREAAMRWTASVRQEMRQLVAEQLEEAAASRPGAAPQITHQGSKQPQESNLHAEAVLGSGKFSDWITLAEIVRPLDNDPIKLSMKMRHRVQLYSEEDVVAFLSKLDIPLDFGYSDASGSFRPSKAQEVIEKKLRENNTLATLPSRRKRELNRFVFEVQNLQTLAIVRFSATYVELLSAQKTGILRLADSHIASLEAAERARHLRIYAKAQERKYAAQIQGKINGVLYLAIGTQQASFASRDAAASQIQACFRAFVIRRSMHHVKLLTAVLKSDAEARQQVRHKVAVPRSSNIRHWLSGVTPWSLGDSSSRGLLDHHLASPTSHTSLLPAKDLTINRPPASVKNDLLDLYLEQTTAYSKFAVAEMDGGAIWRPPTATVRFIGQQWKQTFNSLRGESTSGTFTGASVTRGSTGFTASEATASQPSELVRDATHAMQEFTNTALSPPGSPRAIEQKLREYRWDAIPAKLGGVDTEAHLVAKADSFAAKSQPQRQDKQFAAPSLGQDQSTQTREKPIKVSPFELIPFDLAQTVDAFLDSSKYKVIQESWHTWQTRLADSAAPTSQSKHQTIYTANPNLLATLPTRRAQQLPQTPAAVRGRAASSVSFDLPHGAHQLFELDQPSYDWDAYFQAEKKMFQPETGGKKDSRPIATAVEQHAGQLRVEPKATPLERATKFNRMAAQAAQPREQPETRTSKRPLSATAAAAHAWQTRSLPGNSSARHPSVLHHHKYQAVGARSKKQQHPKQPKPFAQSPAAKYARFARRTSSKAKRLSRPQSAQAAPSSRAIVPSTHIGGAGLAVSPTQSYAAPSRGQTWATASMLAAQAASAERREESQPRTRHLGRSIGNHYADVWSSNKGQLNVQGKWTTKQKVKLRGYDRFGMAKE